LIFIYIYTTNIQASGFGSLTSETRLVVLHSLLPAPTTTAVATAVSLEHIPANAEGDAGAMEAARAARVDARAPSDTSATAAVVIHKVQRLPPAEGEGSGSGGVWSTACEAASAGPDPPRKDLSPGSRSRCDDLDPNPASSTPLPLVPLRIPRLRRGDLRLIAPIASSILCSSWATAACTSRQSSWRRL